MRKGRAVVDQKKGIMREVMMKICVQILNGQILNVAGLKPHIYKKSFTVPLIANFLCHNNRKRFDLFFKFFHVKSCFVKFMIFRTIFIVII